MFEIRRLAAEDDLGDLIALSRAFFDEYQAHHEALFKIDELHDDDIAGYFSQTLDADDGAIFVAMVEGRTAGYITVFIRSQASFFEVKHIGAISGLMIRQDQRRKGIATALMAEARAFFEARGIEYYTVYTAAANEPALDFYRLQNMDSLYVTFLGKTGVSQ